MSDVCRQLVGDIDRHMEQCGQERPCPDHDADHIESTDPAQEWTDALDAAELLLSVEIERRFGKVLHRPHDLTAAVVRAYLDALDPADVATHLLHHGERSHQRVTPPGEIAAVVKGIRP